MTTIKRRDFLKSGSIAAVAGLSPASVLAISESASTARDANRALRLFDAHEARQLDAITERIIPRTETPGAHDLGVMHFIDRACADEMATALGFIQHSIREFDRLVSATDSDAESFADLSESRQIAFLKTQEATPFFQLMGMMTRFGYYGMSKYGGNADHASWALVGYRGHNGGWQYPFGEYDAEVHIDIDAIVHAGGAHD